RVVALGEVLGRPSATRPAPHLPPLSTDRVRTFPSTPVRDARSTLLTLGTAAIRTSAGGRGLSPDSHLTVHPHARPQPAHRSPHIIHRPSTGPSTGHVGELHRCSSSVRSAPRSTTVRLDSASCNLREADRHL